METYVKIGLQAAASALEEVANDGGTSPKAKDAFMEAAYQIKNGLEEQGMADLVSGINLPGSDT